MKTLKTLAAMAALLLTLACAGVSARENVLMPAMSKAFATVVAPAVDRGATEAGVDLGDAVQVFQDALDSGDREQVRVLDWSGLRALALSGIQARVDAGEIGPGVARSLLETVNQFDARHSQLLLR